MLDRLSEGLLYAMIVFSPWAFGTTQAWSIAAMNGAGIALGGLLIAKILFRGSTDFYRGGGRLVLLVLSGAVLLYALISAINAEFIYVAGEWRQEPLAHVRWLPHSLDRDASWQWFWNGLALTLAFWAAVDWLLGDARGDGHLSRRRFRRLVSVAVLNGAIVALEAIIQRSSGTNQLLWFMPTRDNPTAAAQFGPYAYRANAAQFFNLLWPVGLAVWWQQQFHREGRSQAHHWLLPCVMVLVSASLVSLSRGGVGIALFQLAACSLVLVFSRMSSLASKFVVLTGVALTVGAACYLGWNGLSERLQGDPLSGRGETYELAARMTKDYPWFGIGPGAFGSVFQFYRNSPQDYWPGQLHNDWLEILITFGWVGTLLLLAALAIVLFSWWKRSVGIRVPPGVAMLVMIALVGCLAHARFDFPLQIYSIQFVFVLWAAALIAMRGPKQSVSK